MTTEERRFDAIAKAIYEVVTEGYDGHPAWGSLSDARKWRWLRAAAIASGISQAYAAKRARNIRVEQREERAG